MSISFLDALQINTSDDTQWVELTDGSNVFGLYKGSGTPEGTVIATVASLYIDRAGGLWQKTSGSGTANGWVQFGAGVTDTSITQGTLAPASGARSVPMGSNSLAVSSLTTLDFTGTGQFTFTTSGAIETSSTGINVKHTSGASAGALNIYDADDSNFLEVKVPTSIPTNWTMTLPDAPPDTNGKALTSNTAGVTSWTAIGTGMNFQGAWDASSGSFPGGGTAAIGDVYKVSVAGTVDSVSFSVGDSLYAEITNASTSTFSGNWVKIDAEDVVTSVHSRTGAVTSANGDYTASQVTNVPAGNLVAVTVQAALDEIQTELDTVASHSEQYGDAVATDFTITHSLGTEQVNVTVKEETGNERIVYPQVKVLNTTQVMITHATAPASNAYRVTVNKVKV